MYPGINVLNDLFNIKSIIDRYFNVTHGIMHLAMQDLAYVRGEEKRVSNC